MKWSPEQISGWLRRTKPRQKTLRISPETIYKTLYFRSREALHHLNIQHLRRSHSLRHGRRHTRKGERGTINIVNGTPIHERSRNIDNRRSLGHWEESRMVVRRLGEKSPPEAARVSGQEATMSFFGADRPALHAARALSI
jgi:IS30 family transposase